MIKTTKEKTIEEINVTRDAMHFSPYNQKKDNFDIYDDFIKDNKLLLEVEDDCQYSIRLLGDYYRVKCFKIHDFDKFGFVENFDLRRIVENKDINYLSHCVDAKIKMIDKEDIYCNKRTILKNLLLLPNIFVKDISCKDKDSKKVLKEFLDVLKNNNYDAYSFVLFCLNLHMFLYSPKCDFLCNCVILNKTIKSRKKYFYVAVDEKGQPCVKEGISSHNYISTSYDFDILESKFEDNYCFRLVIMPEKKMIDFSKIHDKTLIGINANDILVEGKKGYKLSDEKSILNEKIIERIMSNGLFNIEEAVRINNEKLFERKEGAYLEIEICSLKEVPESFIQEKNNLDILKKIEDNDLDISEEEFEDNDFENTIAMMEI